MTSLDTGWTLCQDMTQTQKRSGAAPTARSTTGRMSSDMSDATKEREFHEAAEAYYSSRFDDRVKHLLELIAEGEGDDDSGEDVRDELLEWPLSVELESHRPNQATCEWSILLGTGGPADRIIVHADEWGDVISAEYQYQGWFQPWYAPQNQEYDVLEAFARLFYFECPYCASDRENAR